MSLSYHTGRLARQTGDVEIETTVLKAMLIDNSSAFTEDATDDYVSDIVAYESDGDGYERKTLANVSASVNDADGKVYMAEVDSINATTITLANPYRGTGGTGSSTVIQALIEIPTGKWVKGLLARTLDGRMHYIPPQNYYDTQDEAEAAGLPIIPAAISQANLKLAELIFQKGGTITVKDIRPLPFHLREGGSQTGGTLSNSFVGV